MRPRRAQEPASRTDRRQSGRRTESGAAARSRGGAQAPSRASGASGNWSEGELAAVRSRIGTLGLTDRFTVPGALSGTEVLAELRRAHVYVLPSVDEPFPMSVLEALSVGVPSVVTHSNGLARDIARAGAGRAVDPGPAGVSAAVLDLLDPAAGREASLSARKLAAESFSMDAVLDTLLPVYEGIRH